MLCPLTWTPKRVSTSVYGKRLFKLLRYGLKAKRAWDATSETRRAIRRTRKAVESVKEVHSLVTEPGPVEAVLDWCEEAGLLEDE